jgi:phosphohistidine phosphatase SixA
MIRTSISRRRTWCVLALLVALGLGPVADAPLAHAQETTTVLVVRHAEKEWEDGDPPLSEVGRERAYALLRVVEESGVSVLFGTQYMRTSQTLEPIAERLDLEILVHEARDSRGLARRILTEHAGRVVLVSGHSNTVPEIVAALGAPEPDPIDDAEYDDLVYRVGQRRGGRSDCPPPSFRSSRGRSMKIDEFMIPSVRRSAPLPC